MTTIGMASVVALSRVKNSLKVLAKIRVPIWFSLIAVSLAAMSGIPSTAFAAEVSVTVDSGVRQRPDATVKITKKGDKNFETVEGTTAKQDGKGRPKFQTNLEPGVYTIETSWLNPQGRTETGTMTYTVTTGKNEPNVVVSEAGEKDQTGSGTSATAANGVTATGPNGRLDTLQNGATNGGPWRLSLSTGVTANYIEGINTLRQFTGGNDDGVDGLTADADTVGHSVRGKFGYGIDGPDTGPGADRLFFGASGQSNWSRSVFKDMRIQAPSGSNYEIPGLSVLSNISTNGVDDVEARTEIDALEFAVTAGLVFNLGPIGNFTIGNLTIGNIGNIGNFGPVNRRRNNVKLITVLDIFYRDVTREDDLRFINSGTVSRYMTRINTDEYGARVRAKVAVPVASGVMLKLGPSFAVFNSDNDLSSTLARGSSNDSFSSSDSKVAYEVGLAASLSAKVGPGTLSTFVNVSHKSEEEKESLLEPRVRAKVAVPVASGVMLKLGPSFAVFNSDNDLSSTLARGSSNDSFSSSDSKVAYEVGLAASLSAKVGPGTLSTFVNVSHKSDSAFLNLRNSNTDVTRLEYDDAQQLNAGLRYTISPVDIFDLSPGDLFDLSPGDRLSDKRLKTNIARVGALPSGLPVYRFEYVWSPVTHIGVMAQEALMRFPEAVHEIDGFLVVDLPDLNRFKSGRFIRFKSGRSIV